MSITAIRGFNDILPNECSKWAKIEAEARRVFALHGFLEIRLPIVERAELFLRTIGETTDIVEKQMYLFKDNGGDSLALRPEGTASAVRAYIEHKLYESPVTRIFYSGPMFRYERPQKGRYRQFYQLGAEVLGDAGPFSDAETIAMLASLFTNIGIKGVSVNVNSLGCEECRPSYKAMLSEFLSAKTGSLCDNCKRRMDKNPLRALDCKSEHCIEATKDTPSIREHLCTGCKEHFSGALNALDALGVSYEINPRMVRGLDYYTRTTFEVIATEGLGSQNAIAAGGRYDNLVKELGGPQTPCFGFAIGMERLALTMPEKSDTARTAHIITMGDGTLKTAMEAAATIRGHGVPATIDASSASLKSKMKKADRIGSRFVIIIGEDELKEGLFSLKDMTAGTQERVTREALLEKLADSGK
ncbi:MAG: histidine--tRNA ligase [Deltaproteobacteria bacterium]|nr:histidine--tRNA ligase [Deltaproteobacteria bacterium]